MKGLVYKHMKGCIQMKMNGNQHLPIEIYDDIYNSIYGSYMNYDYDFDDEFIDDDYSYDRNLNYYGAYMYCYVEEFDKIIFNAGIKEDYETSSELYCDSEGNLFTAYPYFADKKIIALTGAVINAINNIKKPSKKLTKLYNKLLECYPEIVLRIL